MRGKSKIIAKIVLLTAVPTVMNCLAKSNSLLDYMQARGIIGPGINLMFWKDVLLIAAAVISAVFISARLVHEEIVNKNVVKQVMSLLKYNKEIFVSALRSKALIEGSTLNIRIFVLRKGTVLRIEPFLQRITSRRFKFKREFVVRNIQGLAETGLTDGLAFEVFPRQQGLIGSCYRARTIIFDDNFKNNMYRYNMTEYQINKVRDLEFCMCSPIFDRCGEIISIVCFDSTQKVVIPKGSKSVWIDMVMSYCQFLSDYLPDLFRHRG